MYIYIYRYPISHIFWQPHIILLLFHQFFASRLMCIRYLSSLCWMPPAISNESMKGYSEVPRSRRTETWTFRAGEFRWRIGQTLKPCWKPQLWPSRTEIGNIVFLTDSGFCQGPTPDRCWLEIVITKLILARFLVKLIRSPEQNQAPNESAGAAWKPVTTTCRCSRGVAKAT